MIPAQIEFGCPHEFRSSLFVIFEKPHPRLGSRLHLFCVQGISLLFHVQGLIALPSTVRNRKYKPVEENLPSVLTFLFRFRFGVPSDPMWSVKVRTHAGKLDERILLLPSSQRWSPKYFSWSRSTLVMDLFLYR